LASKFSFSIYKKEIVWRFFFHLLSLTEYSFIHVKVQELFLSMASTSRNEKKVSGANSGGSRKFCQWGLKNSAQILTKKMYYEF
jgi:hypothetical protein